MHVKHTANSTGGIDSITSWDNIEDGNLLIDGEIGVSMGGNTDFNTGARFRDTRVCRNVLMRAGQSHQTNRDLGWGDELKDWEGGFYGGNLQVDCDNETVLGQFSYSISGHCSNVALTRNTSVNLGQPVGLDGYIAAFSAAQGGMSNVLDAYNISANPDCNGKIVGNHDVISGITHRDNKYYAIRDPSEWFEYNGVDMNKATWDINTGDTGSTTTPISFVNKVVIEDYMASLGQTATLAEFIEKCKAQGNGTWDNNYTARYVNAYFRAGYKEA